MRGSLSRLRNFGSDTVSVIRASTLPGRAQFTTRVERESVSSDGTFVVNSGAIAPIENHESPCTR